MPFGGVVAKRIQREGLNLVGQPTKTIPHPGDSNAEEFLGVLVLKAF